MVYHNYLHSALLELHVRLALKVIARCQLKIPICQMEQQMLVIQLTFNLHLEQMWVDLQPLLTKLLVQ